MFTLVVPWPGKHHPRLYILSVQHKHVFTNWLDLKDSITKWQWLGLLSSANCSTSRLLAVNSLRRYYANVQFKMNGLSIAQIGFGNGFIWGTWLLTAIWRTGYYMLHYIRNSQAFLWSLVETYPELVSLLAGWTSSWYHRNNLKS